MHVSYIWQVNRTELQKLIEATEQKSVRYVLLFVPKLKR